MKIKELKNLNLSFVNGHRDSVCSNNKDFLQDAQEFNSIISEMKSVCNISGVINQPRMSSRRSSRMNVKLVDITQSGQEQDSYHASVKYSSQKKAMKYNDLVQFKPFIPKNKYIQKYIRETKTIED